MNIKEGKILVSTMFMDNLVFKDSIVLLISCDAGGAAGFIINKPFERPLNALAEFSHSPAFPLCNGGPVDQEHLFFIHHRNDLVSGGQHIDNELFFGGDFKQAIDLINQKILTTQDIKIFIGYCGWDAGELEDEIAAGCWKVVDYNPSFGLFL